MQPIEHTDHNYLQFERAYYTALCAVLHASYIYQQNPSMENLLAQHEVYLAFLPKLADWDAARAAHRKRIADWVISKSDARMEGYQRGLFDTEGGDGNGE